MTEGLILLGQNKEIAGRGITGPRLRTAAARAGFDVFVTDISPFLSKDQIFTIIDMFVQRGIKFLGLSTTWYTSAHVWPGYNCMTSEFFVELRTRYPKLTVITGGQQRYGVDSLSRYIDFHFQGFSDISFAEFLKYINGQPNSLKYNIVHGLKIIESNIHFQLNHPNDIATVFEPGDNFLAHQPVPLELSRGCIFRCMFCRHPFQGKKDYDSYQRTPESIAVELKRNYDLFGTTRYTILDDTINDSMEKLQRLQQALDLAKLPQFEFVGYIKGELLVTKPQMIDLLADLGLRGAFIGIESLKNSTRKILGKGTDIEKVKEAIFKLSQVKNKQVLVHGSFIVGLPEETPEDVYETYEFLVKHNKSFCRSWIFQNLLIFNDKDSTSEKSGFDKNPEKFSYFFKDNSKMDWENQFFTAQSARKLTDLLNKKSTVDHYYGGFRVAGAWHLDTPNDQIQNQLVDPNFDQRLLALMQERTKIEYEKLISSNKF